MLEISNHSVAKDVKKHKIHTLDTLAMPRNGKVLARWLFGLFALNFAFCFLPWQQNISGYGKITALNPADRPQTIESAIPGRIVKWKINEGQFVRNGDTILVLSEVKDDYFDPNLVLRLNEQVQAKENSIEATKSQIQFTEKQLNALRAGLRFKLQQARNKVQQARMKVTIDSAEYANEQVQYEIAEKQFRRFEALFQEKGIVSLTELENRRRSLQSSKAKLTGTLNKFMVSKNEYLNAVVDLSGIDAEYGDKINKAETEYNGKLSYLADAESELSKLKNKLGNVRVRQNNYSLIAPQDGFVVKALKAGIGETIKEGEAVATIQPHMPGMAVELYVRAMDVPLISRGRHVRIEFEGWPSLQFSGWPNVSVGTFGGTVKVIDYVNSHDGTYRLLVVPDKTDIPWPEQLRLGSGVLGWVMLDDVPIWFELWRQLNGFPPSLKKAPEDNELQGKKKEGDKPKK